MVLYHKIKVLSSGESSLLISMQTNEKKITTDLEHGTSIRRGSLSLDGLWWCAQKFESS